MRLIARSEPIGSLPTIAQSERGTPMADEQDKTFEKPGDGAGTHFSFAPFRDDRQTLTIYRADTAG